MSPLATSPLQELDRDMRRAACRSSSNCVFTRKRPGCRNPYFQRSKCDCCTLPGSADASAFLNRICPAALSEVILRNHLRMRNASRRQPACHKWCMRKIASRIRHICGGPDKSSPRHAVPASETRLGTAAGLPQSLNGWSEICRLRLAPASGISALPEMWPIG
jgi:hypothetical protein